MDIYKYVETHAGLFEQIPNFVGVGTPDHKYAFSNNKTAKLMGFKKADDIVDISFSDVKCKAAEDAQLFEKENNIVVNQRKKISALGYHRYSTDWSLVLCEKSPLINDDKKVIGVLMYFIDITQYNLVDYSRFIFENKFEATGRKSFSYLIEDGTINNYQLSERQIECLFYLVRGKSDREIGEILRLSPRTVESYIHEIKVKMKCTTRSQLIEKSFSTGLVNIIPKKILK